MPFAEWSFSVYARARWGDAQHCCKLDLDYDSQGEVCFIEGSSAVHKTCRSLHLKHVMLPLVAPARGVCGGKWVKTWNSVRLHLGIKNLDEYPMMPAPSKDGKASVRPLSTSEAGAWVRMLIQREDPHSEIRYTSHSLKATLLSYLAKWGISFSDRLALGYHTQGLKMALTYSRDGASRPLAVLISVIEEIRRGKYNPDETRSGRLYAEGVAPEDKSEHAPDASPVVVNDTDVPLTGPAEADDGGGPVVENSDLEHEADTPVEHVSTDSDSGSEGEHVVVARPAKLRYETPEGTVMWQHSKLRTLHLAFEGHRLSFLCGRKITDMYAVADAAQRFDVPRCRQCFNSKLPSV